jgi:CxxC-x17-CxxC domain-containing protein
MPTKEQIARSIEGYDATCDNCGDPTKLPFKPHPNRPVLCKRCALALTEDDIEKAIEFLKANIDERFLERGAENLALNEQKLSRDPSQNINKIKRKIRNRLDKEIKDKEKFKKILVFLEKTESRFGI